MTTAILILIAMCGAAAAFFIGHTVGMSKGFSNAFVMLEGYETRQQRAQAEELEKEYQKFKKQQEQ